MPLMTQDLLLATLRTISARVTVEWPPRFKEQYASRSLAIEEKHTPLDTGFDSRQWLADNLQHFDKLGVLMDATETATRDVLIDGTDGVRQLEDFDRVMAVMNAARSTLLSKTINGYPVGKQRLPRNGDTLTAEEGHIVATVKDRPD